MTRHVDSARYVRLDQDFDYHPKIVVLPPLAVWLLVRCVLYCARQKTDGAMPRVVALDLARQLGDTALAQLLIDRNLLHEGGDDVLHVHDYADWQRTRMDIEHVRQARSVAGKASAEKRKAAGLPAVLTITAGHPNKLPREAEAEAEAEKSAPPPSIVTDPPSWVGDRCIATWEKDIGGPISPVMRGKLTEAITPLAARGVSEERITAALRRIREKGLALRLLPDIADEVHVPKPTNVPPPFVGGEEQPPEVAARGAALARAVLTSQSAEDKEEPDHNPAVGGDLL